MLDDIKKTLWATADKLRANMDEVLFMDARKQATMISRVQSELTDTVIERLAGTVAA